MASNKHVLAGKLSKRTLTLEEKIKLLDFKKKNPSAGCRAIADKFNIGKTAAASILKDKDKIHQQHELFHEKSKKRIRYGKYKEINDILYEWYKRCCASNIFPNGVMIKEEAMLVKERLQNSDYDGFNASDGWLDGWKTSYAIKERRIVGEAGDVSEETITSWMERIIELTEGYELEDIWNMDESGCFFKALPEKGLVEKGKQAKGGKKSKQRLTVAFFINAAGEKVDQPVVIWRSKVPRCFRKLKDTSRPFDVHYYSNPKSWMTSEVMEAVLTHLNRKLSIEGRKVILLLDNATCHPESFVDRFSQIKLVFLPKNTTSRLQPLDAGIIQSFKVKYRKRLVKYVLARIDKKESATEIVKNVDILQAIRWVQESWKEVTNATIKNCFEKCGIIKKDDELMDLEEDDLEFEALLREFTPDVSALEYANFDADIQASEPMINDQDIDWRERVREDAINAVKNPVNLSIEISDDEINENENGDCSVETGNNDRERNIGCRELITILDKLQKCSLLDNDSQAMLSTITKKIEDIQIANRKQTTITNFFLSK